MAQPTSDSGAVGQPTRIGHATLAATASFADVRAAIERSNATMRVAGLDDRLNPDVVDLDKATALLRALPALARRSPQLLDGRELLLTHGPLRIGSADATTPEDFARPFELVEVDVQGKTLLARSTVAVRPELARARAAEARSALQAENARIAPLEARLAAAAASVDEQRRVLDELTPAQQRRSAIARAWFDNAGALAEQPGADAAAKADAAAARRALDDYLVPGAGGMPR